MIPGAARPGACRELEVLRDLIRHEFADAGSIGPVAPDDLDWSTFLRCVRHHRLADFLDRALTEGLVPHGPREALRRLRRASAMADLTRKAALRRLTEGAAARGIDLLALKGPAFAAQVGYGRHRRPSVDVDILVRAGQRAAAEDLLRGMGYALSAQRAQKHTRTGEWREAQGGVLIDLHDHVADEPGQVPVGRLDPFAHRTRVDLGGFVVETLSVEAGLVLAAYHGAKHLWFRWFWLIDFVKAMDNPAIDWPRVTALARHVGLAGHLAAACALTIRILDRAPPPALVGLDVDRALRRVEPLVAVMMAAPPETYGDAIHRWGLGAYVWWDVTNYDRLSGRLSALRHHFRPTDRDRAVITLKAPFDRLYPLVRLARLLVTRGRR